MEKVNKQQLNDFELENVTGGGVAAYAIKGGCAFVGTVLGGFLYMDTGVMSAIMKVIPTSSQRLINLRHAVSNASYLAFEASGFAAGWYIGEKICERYGIK